MSSAVSLTRSGTVSFAPRARLLKLIGGELVSDEVVAVTELVKNAYDADARTVTVCFSGLGTEDSEIVISDNGHGMSLSDVTTYWMQPGGTTKAGEKRRVSDGGRPVLGEKGIGRFAVDKLGSSLTLISRAGGESDEVLCNFDWDAFEHETRMLSDVQCAWETRSPQTFTGHGTVLRIRGLRADWTERLFRKLCLRLSRLKSPFDANDRFRIIIDSEDFPDYSGELSVEYLDRAPHSIEADFDGDQIIRCTDASGTTDLIWNGAGSLECGPVRIRLYAFDLETSALAKIGQIREVRGWLREWTGVSVYRDGFRLTPYGEPHDDWLRLDQRRVNNPVVRLSNNQVIGFVEIGRMSNPELLDQTNREGMISNAAFEHLRRLLLFVMQQLEAARQRVRHPVKKATGAQLTATADHHSVADELSRISAADEPVKPARLRSLAKKVRNNAQRDELRFKAFSDGYAELAAVGQVAENVIKRTNFLVESLEKKLEESLELTRGSGVPGLARSLRSTAQELNELKEELLTLAPLSVRHGQRRRTIDVARELDRFGSSVAQMVEAQEVKLLLPSLDHVVRAEMGPENFQRMLHILVTNSLDWLKGVPNPRVEIRVSSDVADGTCEIRILDNGPGIPTQMHDRIFDPLESGREGARGMGLTIARSLVLGASGSIGVSADKRRTGACIWVKLPRKRARVVRRR